MSVYTLFPSFKVFAFKDPVDSPELSESDQVFSVSNDFNVLYRKLLEITVDSGDSQTVTFPNLALAEWPMIIARVVGEVSFDTAGKDNDGTTSISGKLPGYGTTLFPGVVVFNMKNLTSIAVAGLADGTVVELFGALLAADSDTRLTTNA